MSAATELARTLLTALADVPGVRPATPMSPSGRGWVPWDWDLLAVDVDPDEVCVRLIATRLPLPPLLADATRALRAVLDTGDRPHARLRLEVTDIDRVAFSARPGLLPGPRQGDADHTIVS